MSPTIASPRPPADLARAGADLVRRLGGIWDEKREQGLCRCPAHLDHDPSLSVRVGERALLFHCFAGCTNLEVVRHLSRIRPDALRHGSSAAGDQTPVDDGRILSRIRALWGAAADAEGTPVQSYLGHRGIQALPGALRYHAQTPLGPRGAVRFRPAMLASVREGPGIVALQRTFLDIDRCRRARDLTNPRRMLGRPGRGSVRLAPAFDILGLAEGIESALSAMILLGLPIWATLGNERFGRVDVPLSVRRLLLLADNDPAGRLAADAARMAHAAPGRIIETLWPWHGLNDWNDVLRAEEKGVGDRARHAA